MTFVAACHFPGEQLAFTKTRKKFCDDLVASLCLKRNGFIFMTNQHLTPKERNTLEKAAAREGKRCLIFHREYLRVVLDSPNGYGIRLRHLRIPLSVEEQFAYFASFNESTAFALAAQTTAIERLSQRIERTAKAQARLVLQSAAVVVDAIRSEEGAEVNVAEMLKASVAVTESHSRAANDAVSAQLSTALLRYMHRLIMPADPTFAGRYRQTQVWLVDPTGAINADLECPSWDKIPMLMEQVVEDWNREYTTISGSDERSCISAMAKFFHRLLSIHPFIDGNGRLARGILSLQVRDILGFQEDLLLDRGAPYYRALRLADVGKLAELQELIKDAIDDQKGTR